MLLLYDILTMHYVRVYLKKHAYELYNNSNKKSYSYNLRMTGGGGDIKIYFVH